MANTEVYYDEVRIDVRADNHTDVYVFCRFVNDSPLADGWRHKEYSAGIPAQGIMSTLWSTQEDDPLFWPMKNPSTDGIDKHVDKLEQTIKAYEDKVFHMALGGFGVSTYQARVAAWLHDTFGMTIAEDGVERNHRFLEEALELCQACGCTKEEANQLVDYVFSRPVGEKGQEVGGVMVTLASLCFAQHLNMVREGENELTRVEQPEVQQKIRDKQAKKPKFGPLPGPTEDAYLQTK